MMVGPQSSDRPPEAFSRWRCTAADILCLAALLILCGWIFGERSHLLGFYSDDAGFITAFNELSPVRMWTLVSSYIPGRNLHLFWEYLILSLTGTSLESLTAQHWIQSGLASMNAAACFIVLRMLLLPALPSFLAALIFAFYPNHAEALFWLQAIPMQLISTLLVLILIIFAILAIRAALNRRPRIAGLFLALQFIFFFPAMFTYDQADGATMVVCGATAVACFALSKRLRLPSFLAAMTYIATFIGLVVWKIQDPRGGPGFSNLNVDHVLANLRATFSLNFSDGLFDYLFANVLPHSGDFEREMALIAVLTTLAVGSLCQWMERTNAPASRAGPAPERGPQGHSLSTIYSFSIVLGAIGFFFVAYMPAIIWYISPRHNYLPSLGIAAAVAGLLYLFDKTLYRIGGATVARVGAIMIVGCTSLLLYDFVQAVLVEKNAWILSYQARKNLFSELALDPRFKRSSALVLEDFPTLTPFGVAPLGYLQATEVTLMTKGAADIRHLVRSSIGTRAGEFIYVEPDQWGPNAFLHVPAQDVFHVRYGGMVGDRLSYATQAPSRDVPVESQELSDEVTAGDGGTVAARPYGIVLNEIELSFAPVSLKPDEVLAVRPLTARGGVLVPILAPVAAGPSPQVLVDLPRSDGRRRYVRIRFKPDLPKVKAVELFVVSESGRRKVGEAAITE
jgi:hypothetical protein